MLDGLGVCALAWSIWLLATAASPSIALTDKGSDHFSHVFGALLFLDHGFDVYRARVEDLCKPRTPQEREAVAAALQVDPGDVCWEEGFSRPLVINWPTLPRPYPPGEVLFFLPEALLYRYGGWSFGGVNAVCLVALVLAAHLAAGLLWLALREQLKGWLLLPLWLVAYAELVHWALMGFYDPLFVALLLGAVLALRGARGSLALLLFSGAVFLHFRALWYAPLFLAAAIRALPELEARRAVTSLRVALACSLVGLSGWALFLLRGHLAQWPTNSPLAQLSLTSHAGWGFAAATVGLVALSLRRREWLLTACLASTSAILLATRQTFWWHSVGLLPMLSLPSRGTERQKTLTIVVCFGWYLAIAHWVFSQNPLWPDWLADVVARS